MLLNSCFRHDLDSKRLTTILMHTEAHKPKCTLAKCFAKYIPVFDIFKFLERLVAFHSYAIHRRLIARHTTRFIFSLCRWCIIIWVHTWLLLNMHLVHRPISWVHALLIVCSSCSRIFKFLVIALSLHLFRCTTNTTKLLHLSSGTNGLLWICKIVRTGTTSSISSAITQFRRTFTCIHLSWTKSLSSVGPLSWKLHINIFRHSLKLFICIRSITINCISLLLLHILWRLTISIWLMTRIILSRVITHLHIVMLRSICIGWLLFIIIWFHWHVSLCSLLLKTLWIKSSIALILWRCQWWWKCSGWHPAL